MSINMQMALMIFWLKEKRIGALMMIRTIIGLERMIRLLLGSRLLRNWVEVLLDK